MKFNKFDKEKSIPHVLRIIEKLGHKSTFAVEGILKSAHKSSKKDFVYAYKTLANSVFQNDSKINDDIAFFILKSMIDLIPETIDLATKKKLLKIIHKMLDQFE